MITLIWTKPKTQKREDLLDEKQNERIYTGGTKMPTEVYTDGLQIQRERSKETKAGKWEVRSRK